MYSVIDNAINDVIIFPLVNGDKEVFANSRANLHRPFFDFNYSKGVKFYEQFG